MFDEYIKIPWAEVISNHPWSIDFMELRQVFIGDFSRACEERGTRNHIKAFMWLSIGAIEDGEVEVVFSSIRIAPATVTMRAGSFNMGGRTGSFIGRINIQFIVLPPMMAPRVNINIGVVLDNVLSEIYWIGMFMLFEIRAVDISRIEYAAVIIVASKNIVMISMFDLLNRHISIIRSLE